jgi:hypothetical protein
MRLNLKTFGLAFYNKKHEILVSKIRTIQVFLGNVSKKWLDLLGWGKKLSSKKQFKEYEKR